MLGADSARDADRIRAHIFYYKESGENLMEIILFLILFPFLAALVMSCM